MSRKVVMTVFTAALLSVVITAANAADIKSDPKKFINADGTTQQSSARARANTMKAASDTQNNLASNLK